MEILPLILTASIAFIIGYLFSRLMMINKISKLTLHTNVAAQRIAELYAANQKLETMVADKEQSVRNYIAELSKSQADASHLNEKLNDQKVEVETLQLKFSTAFRNLANEIMEEKSVKFTEQNKANIHDLLFPLGEKIKDFEKKVEDAYDKELREKVSLKTELKGLFDLNKQLSEEANNLVKALKGDTKQQGNWGELILEKILEHSGLTKNRDYTLQHASQNTDGRSIQPDAVIFLPDNKHLIIDSKVSLIAYEQAMNASNVEERTVFLKQHLQSVKNHIRLLSEKKYHTASGLHAPDFVFLFLWSEAAFSAALQTDAELFHYAWERNIAIVSPTTIWANLKTIASIRKMEQQNRNAEEIARQGADLYDKLVGFVDDLLLIGKKIDEAKKSHDDAMNKLHSGTGNLIRRAEKMKVLGLKPAKNLPVPLVEASVDGSN
ncbi:MAG: DNA recombination protein RmuC [Chitinophagaceae bacterium]|nr:DNA recombination protein RmuC [Chitinophagaceae bacterium]